MEHKELNSNLPKTLSRKQVRFLMYAKNKLMKRKLPGYIVYSENGTTYGLVSHSEYAPAEKKVITTNELIDRIDIILDSDKYYQHDIVILNLISNIIRNRINKETYV